MKPTSLRLRSGTPDTLRGLMSFFGGAAVSLATLLVLPETPVQFGVLTFLGSAALLTIPLRPLLSRIPPRPGLALSFALFLVLWKICELLGLGTALTAVLVGRLAQLESFGVPYLAPFAPGQGKDGYGVLRWPTHRVKFREAILHTRNRRRQG